MRRKNFTGQKRSLIDFFKRQFLTTLHPFGVWFSKSRQKDEASFLARKMFSTHFSSTFCMWKMFLGVQAIFWYNFQHHTTRRTDLATAESHFCRFFENHTPKGWRAVKNCFLKKSMRLRFWPVKFFLRIFQARCACKKCSLESRLSSDITYSIIQHVEMIWRQLRAIFVDF